MDREQLDRIVGSVSSAPGGRLLEELCRVCADELEVGGAGITLFVEDRPWGPWGASNKRAAQIEGLQLMFGVGPCVDAHRLGRPVVEPDLSHPDATRWPGLAEPALAAGAAALFSFPLRLGAARLGVLTIHQPRPGPLHPEQHDDAVVIAEVFTSAILAVPARESLEGQAPDLDLLADHRASLHQAAGMVSVQLEVSIVDAMVRLRAHAYASGRPLGEVADDVVARRLRLDGDAPEWREGPASTDDAHEETDRD